MKGRVAAGRPPNARKPAMGQAVATGAAVRHWARGPSRPRPCGRGKRPTAPGSRVVLEAGCLPLLPAGEAERGRGSYALHPRDAARGTRPENGRVAPCGPFGVVGWDQRPALSLPALPPPSNQSEGAGCSTCQFGAGRHSHSTRALSEGRHNGTWKRNVQPPFRRALLSLFRSPLFSLHTTWLAYQLHQGPCGCQRLWKGRGGGRLARPPSVGARQAAEQVILIPATGDRDSQGPAPCPHCAFRMDPPHATRPPPCSFPRCEALSMRLDEGAFPAAPLA